MKISENFCENFKTWNENEKSLKLTMNRASIIFIYFNLRNILLVVFVDSFIFMNVNVSKNIKFVNDHKNENHLFLRFFI